MSVINSHVGCSVAVRSQRRHGMHPLSDVVTVVIGDAVTDQYPKYQNQNVVSPNESGGLSVMVNRLGRGLFIDRGLFMGHTSVAMAYGQVVYGYECGDGIWTGYAWYTGVAAAYGQAAMQGVLVWVWRIGRWMYFGDYECDNDSVRHRKIGSHPTDLKVALQKYYNACRAHAHMRACTHVCVCACVCARARK